MSIIPYSADVRKKVKQAFDEKRERAFDRARDRKAEVHLRVEGLREIDNELSRTGLKVYAESLDKGSSVPLESRIEALREENAELRRAREQLLADAGYPADYTKPRFECEKCSDTGYVGLKPCECLITALRREAYMSSGLGSMLSGQSFDNFDIGLYPEKSRHVMEFNLKCAREFSENFGKEGYPVKNMMFYGGTGLGKTHLSTAIAKKLIDRGFYVVYDSSLNIMHAFEKERFSREDVPMTTDRYFECDLLIIDDLGAEYMNSFTHSVLYNILNTRIYSGKGTLINTNISNSAVLRKTYDDRVFSRIVGEFRSYAFEGSDIRLVNKKQNPKK